MRPIRILVFLLGAGCASAPVPSDRVAASEASIRAAEEVGAQRVPAAALHLQLAREQADAARELIRQHQNERARYMLLRAEADAELALSMARGQAMQADAQRALDQVHGLQQGKTL
jgi:Domain of unknown function (DUF4398)